jgi:hypothetical protein
MKYHTLPLLDSHGVMIAKVTMTKNKMFLLNIETNVLKCIMAYHPLKAHVKDET